MDAPSSSSSLPENLPGFIDKPSDQDGSDAVSGTVSGGDGGGGLGQVYSSRNGVSPEGQAVWI